MKEEDLMELGELPLTTRYGQYPLIAKGKQQSYVPRLPSMWDRAEKLIT